MAEQTQFSISRATWQCGAKRAKTFMMCKEQLLSHEKCCNVSWQVNAGFTGFSYRFVKKTDIKKGSFMHSDI